MSYTALSLALITFNEADRLGLCLAAAAQIADEIVIVDSHSSDETVTIAQNFKARIIHQPFLGFGKQKQLAVQSCINNWVLIIDADEILSPELINTIKSLKNNDFNGFNGFQLSRYFYFLGRKMKGGNEQNKPYLRLFNKSFGNFNDSPVHEDVVLQNAKVARLKEPLLHYSYRDLNHYFEKYNQYTRLASEKIAKQGKTKSTLWLFMRFQIGFWHYFIFKGFFKDGFPGFIWSFLSATYPVVKYAKANALQNYS